MKSTYQKIGYLLDQMAQNCDTIILEINSPGGMLAGCFDLTDKIYLLRQKVKIFAIIDECCYSGAYALASSAHKIYLSRSAGAGSIGVISTHIDQTGFNDKLGVKFTPIFAGAKKNDGSPHFPLSDRARADLQDFINTSYDEFCRIVARNRNISASAVKATEAGCFYDQGAIKAGLIDAIANRQDALVSIATSKALPSARVETSAPKTKQPEESPLVTDARARAKVKAPEDTENPLLKDAKSRTGHDETSRRATAPSSACYLH
jgi:signal peptide peptidase SppA